MKYAGYRTQSIGFRIKITHPCPRRAKRNPHADKSEKQKGNLLPIAPKYPRKRKLSFSGAIGLVKTTCPKPSI